MSLNHFGQRQNQSDIDQVYNGQEGSQDQKVNAKEYLELFNLYRVSAFTRTAKDDQALKQHRMRYIQNENSILLKDQLKLRKSDSVFSIINTQFNGLEYKYQILIGPFILQIFVLNLNRNSDDGDEDIQREEIGAGGFGSVRVVRINNQQFAIKRIPFRFKFQKSQGYDLEAQSSEQYQVRRCLREFCMFKICSLLGIGPKLVETSYDIICFSNCIEFRMELCETISSNQFFINHPDISMQNLKSDLSQKIIKLHSLNIVHRDIKPDNLLYSPSRKQFIFGDFGMNMIIKESFNEKTVTKFAGTVNFCGVEMKRLLNGQKGWVNLYLNDFQSLKYTFNSLQENVVSQNSQISHNSMSYNLENYNSLQDFSNFSFNEESGSIRNQTDASYSEPATQSLINFATASTEAPKRLATSINHHQSQLIYMFCRRIQRGEVIMLHTFYQIIEEKIDKYENQDIVISMVLEITSLLNISKSNRPFSSYLAQWKNASRHYGPSSEFTIQLLNNIILKLQAQSANTQSQTIRANLLHIKQQMIHHSQHSALDKKQIIYYRAMGHYYNYSASLINYIKCQLSNQKGNEQSKQQNSVGDFIAKQYLFTIKNLQIKNSQFHLISQLVLKYFIKLWQCMMAEKLQPPSLGQLRNKLDYSDKACYILSLILFNRRSLYTTIQILMNELIEQFEQSNDKKLAIFISSLSINLIKYNQKYKEIAQTLLKKYIRIFQYLDSQQKVYLKLQLMIAYSHSNQYSQLFCINDEIVSNLNDCKDSLLHWQYINIIRLKLLGETYLNLEKYQQSQTYYKQSLNQIWKHYGKLQKIDDIFDIINNLALIQKKRKQFNNCLKLMKWLKEIIQLSDRKEFVEKRIYIYQIIIMLRCHIGIVTEEDKEDCRQAIRIIIQFSYHTQHFQQIQIHKQALISALKNILKKQDRYFIQVQALKVLSQQHFKMRFSQMYLSLVLSVSKYLAKDMGFLNKGIRQLWNYIQFKNKYPNSMQQQDFQTYNMFTSLLIRTNSNRRAIIFLKTYIFRIPINYYAAKKVAFQLMYRACSKTNDKMLKIHHQLVKNDFSMLKDKNYESLLLKETEVYRKVLLKKWLERV